VHNKTIGRILLAESWESFWNSLVKRRTKVDGTCSSSNIELCFWVKTHYWGGAGGWA